VQTCRARLSARSQNFPLERNNRSPAAFHTQPPDTRAAFPPDQEIDTMTDTKKLARTAVAAALALGLSGVGVAAAADMEKCYGVAKAGKNDCQTATSSCAGTAKEDRQADAFIALPKGSCEKIVGGSTTPPAT
jgi:uncharacterized membrane protein